MLLVTDATVRVSPAIVHVSAAGLPSCEEGMPSNP